MSTRSLAARLKRLEFRSAPSWEPPDLVISIVGPKRGVLYKMRLGRGGYEYFSVDDQPITKEEADRLSAASEKAEPF